MSVAAMLGVDDLDGPMMTTARNKWPRWTLTEAALGPVGDLLDLPAWTRTATPDAKDAVLRVLAKLGAPDAGNDEAATTALVWALVPGAAHLAARLSDLSYDIDELVSAQLWIAAKTFPWRTRASTAASILRETRRAVLCELGVGDPARRQDRAWANATRLAPDSPIWQSLDHPVETDVDPARELAEVLARATVCGVVDAADLQLLIDLAEAAHRAAAPSGYGKGGLMAPTPSEAVAELRGIHARTVRRRARRTILRLSALNKDALDMDALNKDPWDSAHPASGGLGSIGSKKDCWGLSTDAGSLALGA